MATEGIDELWALGVHYRGQSFEFPLMTRLDAMQVRDIIMLKCGDVVSTTLSAGPGQQPPKWPAPNWSDGGSPSPGSVPTS